MAQQRKKSSGGSSTSKVSGWGGPATQWSNFTPNNQDRLWLDSNSDRVALLGGEFLAEISDGEKVTLKRDDRSGRWNAIYFIPVGDGGEKQVAISCRAATANHALLLLAYYVVVRCEWSIKLPEEENLGLWG